MDRESPISIRACPELQKILDDAEGPDRKWMPYGSRNACINALCLRGAGYGDNQIEELLKGWKRSL